MSLIGDIDNDQFASTLAVWMKIKREPLVYQSDMLNVFQYFMEQEMHERIEFMVELISQMHNTDELSKFRYELFTYTFKNIELLEYLYMLLEPEYNDLVTFFIFRPDLMISVGVRNLDVLFPRENMPDEVLSQIPMLYRLASNSKNTVMMEYLGQLSGEPLSCVKYGNIPPWVIVPEKIVSHNQLVKSLRIPKPEPLRLNASETIDYILGSVPEDTDMDDVKKNLERSFLHMKEDERNTLLNELHFVNEEVKLTLNSDLFRIFGACLPTPGKILTRTSYDPCRMRGGCRMLTCWEHENINPITGDDIVENPIGQRLLHTIEWFTGECQNTDCKNVIDYKHFAIRIPMVTGGWKGCYCSFNCIKQVVMMDNVVLRKLIKHFENMYKVDVDSEYGILHRTW